MELEMITRTGAELSKRQVYGELRPVVWLCAVLPFACNIHPPFESWPAISYSSAGEPQIYTLVKLSV